MHHPASRDRSTVDAPTTRVTVLGSTGSVGTQALDLIRRNSLRFEVVGLANTGRNVDEVVSQVVEFAPEAIALSDSTTVDKVVEGLRDRAPEISRMPEVLAGASGVEELARWRADVVLNAITGAQGLGPTLATLRAGQKLALANKESLVIGGELVLRHAGEDQIVPVDSEHSALAQCLAGGSLQEVHKLVLTANGGPFRGRARAELTDVTVEEALNHPKWSMGPVITINSATLFNKGLEVIEANLLFGVPISDIRVVAHPESIVHSMVMFRDGATIAQAGVPDMAIPIALGLAWPDRLEGASAHLEWDDPMSWNFEPIDTRTFRALDLARAAGIARGTAPAILNAANEVCVDAFLAGQISFLDISDFVERFMDSASIETPESVDALLAADKQARAQVREFISSNR